MIRGMDARRDGRREGKRRGGGEEGVLSSAVLSGTAYVHVKIGSNHVTFVWVGRCGREGMRVKV